MILFHEDDLHDDMREQLMLATRSHLIFQDVSEVLRDVTVNIPDQMWDVDMEYRHMTRFKVKTIYELPIMRRLDYAWRMDDESILLGDIAYDIFSYMSDNDVTYGYRHLNYESWRRSDYLWSTVRTYIRNNSIKTDHFDEWPERQQFNNNFEVSSMKLWYSQEYQSYIDMIDLSKGDLLLRVERCTNKICRNGYVSTVP